MQELLNEVEKDNAVWRKVDAYLVDRMQSLMKQNLNPLSHEDTCVIRGRVAEIRRLRSKIAGNRDVWPELEEK